MSEISVFGAVKQMVKGLLSSKKFVTSVTGGLVALALRLGLPAEVADDVAGGVVLLTSILVGAQGLADHGKEAAKVDAQASEQEKPTQGV